MSHLREHRILIQHNFSAVLELLSRPKHLYRLHKLPVRLVHNHLSWWLNSCCLNSRLKQIDTRVCGIPVVNIHLLIQNYRPILLDHQELIRKLD